MNRRLEFTVTNESAGKSVREFLQEQLAFSGHQISRLKFQKDGIRINGERKFMSAMC